MAATKNAAAPKKAADGPSYEAMIKEAILAHPEASRVGLSRPLLKKWIQAKHPATAQRSPTVFSSSLSRAIVKGADKKVFVLPKGLTGKVKLAPSVKAAAVKKAAAPKPAKAKAKAKVAAKPAKKPAKKTSSTTKKVAAKPKANTATAAKATKVTKAKSAAKPKAKTAAPKKATAKVAKK